MFINDDYDIIHNDSDIEIGHNVDTSVQCVYLLQTQK